ncbi:MAG: hypothetical protein H0W42_07525 [Gemmatimonadaceae bacterium]|nr:hypothetical protein [Gemmatimonadaceae bacterium]
MKALLMLSPILIGARPLRSAGHPLPRVLSLAPVGRARHRDLEALGIGAPIMINGLVERLDH